MQIFTNITPSRLQALIDHIRTDTSGWKAVDVSIEGADKPDTQMISERIKTFFGDTEGAIFVCGSRKILTLGMLGEGIDFGTLKQQLAAHLPEYNCTINTGNITREGLEVIAIRLQVTDAGPSAPQPAEAAAVSLLGLRMQRSKKVFFVVDDDLFMRSLLTKALAPYGEVVALDDGKDLLQTYREKNPDVVFLDIHLPCGSGVDLLEDIMHFDNTAGVVILSADRIKDNVLLAQARGARSFVAKPFTKEKIEEAMNKCLEQATLLAR
ncbi:MAG: response regulator [Alphaproteobacteria bacterium]|nr:response regulator [Alphaproteobacteria bacterium]